MLLVVHCGQHRARAYGPCSSTVEFKFVSNFPYVLGNACWPPCADEPLSTHSLSTSQPVISFGWPLSPSIVLIPFIHLFWRQQWRDTLSLIIVYSCYVGNSCCAEEVKSKVLRNVEVTFPVEFFSFSWISTIIFYSRSPHRCPRSSFHCTKVV